MVPFILMKSTRFLLAEDLTLLCFALGWKHRNQSLHYVTSVLAEMNF